MSLTFFYLLLGVRKRFVQTSGNVPKVKLLLYQRRTTKLLVKVITIQTVKKKKKKKKTTQNRKTFYLHRPFKTNKKQLIEFIRDN